MTSYSILNLKDAEAGPAEQRRVPASALSGLCEPPVESSARDENFRRGSPRGAGAGQRRRSAVGSLPAPLSSRPVRSHPSQPLPRRSGVQGKALHARCRDRAP